MSDTTRDNEALYWRALVESSPDMILVVDTEGTALFVNRMISPFEGEGVLGRKLWEFTVGAGEERIRCAIRQIIETREAIRYEAPGYTVGGLGWYEVSAIPLVIGGKVERILWAARDITERRSAVEKLAFQAAVLSEVSQPVVATDARGGFTYWNAAAERVYGWTQEEVLGRDSETLLCGRWVVPTREAFLQALGHAGTASAEMVHVTKSGEEIIVQVSTRVIRDKQGTVTGSIAVMQDITLRKRLEEQLRQSQKMESIGLLAGGVAHDFNNLLAVILGYAELAQRKIPTADPVSEDMREIAEAARRGGELTRKLLAFSRKQIIQLRPVEVCTLVEDFTRMLQRIVGEDIDVAVEQPDDARNRLVVLADAGQLEQVLLNLCTNARQAMPAGGKLRLATRAVRFDADFVQRHPWATAGDFAEIAVSDTGIGMDEATRGRVFEPFFTTKREGTGLGLATVYGIVQQHRGFVHLETAAAQGTTFRVYLPRAPEDAMPAAPPARESVSSDPHGREQILLAEDEPALRALVTTTLSDLGYRVIATVDGEEAVDAYSRHAPDISLVVLDVVMPRLDAREAFERMREIRPDVKVLFTTGYAPESTRLGELLDTARPNAVNVLLKPFTPQALAAKVRSAIDG